MEVIVFHAGHGAAGNPIFATAASYSTRILEEKSNHTTADILDKFDLRPMLNLPCSPPWLFCIVRVPENVFAIPSVPGCLPPGFMSISAARPRTSREFA